LAEKAHKKFDDKNREKIEKKLQIYFYIMISCDAMMVNEREWGCVLPLSLFLLFIYSPSFFLTYPSEA